mgnify:CR=1 FL=1
MTKSWTKSFTPVHQIFDERYRNVHSWILIFSWRFNFNKINFKACQRLRRVFAEFFQTFQKPGATIRLVHEKKKWKTSATSTDLVSLCRVNLVKPIERAIFRAPISIGVSMRRINFASNAICFSSENCEKSRALFSGCVIFFQLKNRPALREEKLENLMTCY